MRWSICHIFKTHFLSRTSTVPHLPSFISLNLHSYINFFPLQSVLQYYHPSQYCGINPFAGKTCAPTSTVSIGICVCIIRTGYSLLLPVYPLDFLRYIYRNCQQLQQYFFSIWRPGVVVRMDLHRLSLYNILLKRGVQRNYTVKNLRTPCCIQVTKTKDSYLY